VKAENDNRFHLEQLPVAKQLSLVPLSSTFRIERLDGPVQDCNRLLDLGITPGEDVVVTHTAPLGDPLVIRIRGASLALRKREAAWIWVDELPPSDTESSGPSIVDLKEQSVALVGMPNAGKTTLMNALTGGTFKTAN
jgi:Fe2+ transport system protein FeoA